MKKLFCYGLLPAMLIGVAAPLTLPSQAMAATCVASAPTKRGAIKQYKSQCGLPRRDCDKISGNWFCSSVRITNQNRKNIPAYTSTGSLPYTKPASPRPAQSHLHQTIESHNHKSTPEGDYGNLLCEDSDGDGWGWDGTASCKVADYTSEQNNKATRTSSFLTNTSPTNSVCDDPDGDGWGWDGTASCRVNSQTASTVKTNVSLPTYTYTVRDTDRLPPPAKKVANHEKNCSRLDSGDFHITELVTDLIVTAGQSNATGDQTRHEPGIYKEDRPSDRLLVWTSKNQWEIANPSTQTWHDEKYPSGKGQVFNHPAFQIGKALVDSNPCRVVALIATGAPGMPIDHWLLDQVGHYTHINNKVTSAINSLPGKSRVDMIWWMQGEADNDQIVNRYMEKLAGLIKKFRSESWFSHDSYFIANETGWFPLANLAIRSLAFDGDIFTDYSRGEDIRSDPFPNRLGEIKPVHFNSTSLRKIGRLVASKYIREYRR